MLEHRCSSSGGREASRECLFSGLHGYRVLTNGANFGRKPRKPKSLHFDVHSRNKHALLHVRVVTVECEYITARNVLAVFTCGAAMQHIDNLEPELEGLNRYTPISTIHCSCSVALQVGDLPTLARPLSRQAKLRLRSPRSSANFEKC